MILSKARRFARFSLHTWRGRLLLGVLLLLACARLALPVLIERQLLDALKEQYHTARIGDVELSLLQGGYTVEGLEVWDTAGIAPRVPMLTVERIDLGLSWGHLLMGGELVGTISVFEPVLNVIQIRGTEGEDRGDVSRPPAKALGDLFPFRIDRLDVDGGVVRFLNFRGRPPFQLYAQDVRLRVHNLTNTLGLSGDKPGTAELTARVMGHADLEIKLALDALNEQPRFDIDGRLLALDLESVGGPIRAFAPFDVEHGHLDLVLEAAVDGGEVRGYVKPLFTDLSLRAADRDDVTDRIWTRLAAAVLAVLENPRTEQVAARIPLDGPLEDPDVGLLATVLSLLRNAAVRAFEPQLEHTVRLRGEE